MMKSTGYYVLLIISLFFSECSSDRNENNSSRDTISNTDAPQVIDIRVDKPDTLDNEVPPPPPVKIPEIVKFVPPVVVDEPPPSEIPERIVYVEDGNWKSDQNGDEPIMDLEAGPFDIATPQSDIFIAVEQMPEFVGGEVAMMQFIKDNMKYPEAAKSNGVEGKVRVKFTVKKDGTLSDFQIISREKLGYGCEEEAIRLIQSMPKWNPGKQNGNLVNVYYNLPISFRLF